MSKHTTDRPLEAMACTSAVMEASSMVTIRVSPPGLVRSKQGEYLMDREAAELCIEAFTEHGVDVPIDWEHQTLGGAYSAPDGRAPAAGWIKSLHFDPIKGLQAQVAWNPKGRETIRSREYKFLSPVVSVRKSDRRAVAILSAALTNVPAIPASEKLAASTRLNDMEILAMAENSDQATRVGVSLEWMRKLREAVGLHKEATADETLKAVFDKLTSKGDEAKDGEVAQSVRARLGLDTEAGKDEVILAMSVIQGDGNAQTELAAMKQAEAGRVADERINELCRANVINPNNVQQIAAARSLALEDPDRFENLIRGIGPYVMPGRTTPPPRSGGHGRHMTIANAARDYQADESCRKLTTLRAFMDLRLREAGMDKATDEELQGYGT